MKRKIYQVLKEWKDSKYRMPLLLIGSRQVGKTYIVNEFGKNEYENVVYCDLERETLLSKIFESDISPNILIKQIEEIKNQKIIPGKTLLIFDEIQACPRALTSLKYFKEFGNEYHVIGSGSLLGVAINRGGFSFPVGCVDTKTLYPLDFEEFLMAVGRESLIESIKQSYKTNSPISSPIHDILIDLYKQYLYVGGMPSCINEFIASNNLMLVKLKQKEILANYIADMSKYNSASNTTKSILIFNKIADQLAKENKKFKYSILRTGARASEYELALNWICSAGLTHQLFRLEQIKYPIGCYKSYSDFKLYLNDVGLLCALHNVDYDLIKKDKLQEFQGGLVENYVYNQLLINSFDVYYWTSNREAEVDFITKIDSNIIPIEVKSNSNNHSPSLNLFIKRYKPSYSIRISTKNFGFENNILSVPLYAVFCLKCRN